MTTQRCALLNGRIALAHTIEKERALVVEDGKIMGLAKLDSLGSETQCIDVGGRLISPGLIDIHIHGAAGHVFNDASRTAFQKITQECAQRGITALLATTVTAPIANLVETLAFTRRWMSGQKGATTTGAQILGAHVEGPYFNVAQAGAQDPEHIRNPDDGTVDKLLDYADAIRILTFAPELPGALALTERLKRLGIVAAAGHSDAKEEEALPCIEAGLRHMIHIWSGQSSTVRAGAWRKPGLLEVTLTYPQLSAEMIADNCHLPRTLMRLAYQSLGPDRLCIISDATSGAGLPDGARYRMGEVEYVVENGVGMLLNRSAFAGSTTLLNAMLPVLIDVVDVPLVEAVRMATLTPARIIGVDGRKGSIEAGKDADIAIFNEDFSAWRTMIGGRWLETEQDKGTHL